MFMATDSWEHSWNSWEERLNNAILRWEKSVDHLHETRELKLLKAMFR